MLKRISIFWILLTALAITSAVPIIIIAFLEVNSAHDEFEKEARQNLQERTDIQATIYNEQLEEFRLTTDLAATQAQKLLTQRVGTVITDQEVDQRLNRYFHDEDTGEFNLDEWFENVYFPEAQDDHISNVFIEEGRSLDRDLSYTIAVTDSLNNVFGALSDSLDRSTFLGVHNIFLATVNGMFRQYPFISAGRAPQGEFIDSVPELTDAGPENNPERLPVWSAPILNVDLEGHMFVANSMPIYDNRNNYLGVMTHDLDLKNLNESVAELKVGEEGLAFVIDSDGYLVLHPDYRPTEAWMTLSAEEQDEILGSFDNFTQFYTENIDVKPDAYYPQFTPILDEITTGEKSSNLQEFSYNDETWVVSYSLIPETNWYLVLIQPKAELIETATNISDRVQRAGLIMVAGVLLVSFLLARRITKPVTALSETAREIEEHVDAETANLIEQDLQQIGDLGTIREIDNLARVFKQMVFALNSRMVELNSIYTMGQTITSNVEYDATLQAILTAVRQVVSCDAAEIAVKRGYELIVEGWSGNETYTDTTGYRYKRNEGLIGKLIDKPEIIFMPNVPADSEFAMESLTKEVRSLLAIPMKTGEKLIGVMILAHHQPGYFTEDVRRQLSKLSAQASIAIDNAVKVKEREDSLKEKITELKVAVDKSSLEAHVGELSESDFFKDLQKNASKLRSRSSSLDDKEDDTSAPEEEDDQDRPPHQPLDPRLPF